MIEKIDGSLKRNRNISIVINKLNEVIDEINKLRIQEKNDQ